MNKPVKRLTRSSYDKMLMGVGGGLARYFDIDPTLVRIGLALAGLFSLGTAVVVYIVVALIMPEE